MGNCLCWSKSDDFDEVKEPSGSWLKTPDTVTDGFPSSIHFTIGASDLSVLPLPPNQNGANQQKQERVEVQESTVKKINKKSRERSSSNDTIKGEVVCDVIETSSNTTMVETSQEDAGNKLLFEKQLLTAEQEHPKNCKSVVSDSPVVNVCEKNKIDICEMNIFEKDDDKDAKTSFAAERVGPQQEQLVATVEDKQDLVVEKLVSEVDIAEGTDNGDEGESRLAIESVVSQEEQCGKTEGSIV